MSILRGPGIYADRLCRSLVGGNLVAACTAAAELQGGEWGRPPHRSRHRRQAHCSCASRVRAFAAETTFPFKLKRSAACWSSLAACVGLPARLGLIDIATCRPLPLGSVGRGVGAFDGERDVDA